MAGGGFVAVYLSSKEALAPTRWHAGTLPGTPVSSVCTLCLV